MCIAFVPCIWYWCIRLCVIWNVIWVKHKQLFFKWKKFYFEGFLNYFLETKFLQINSSFEWRNAIWALIYHLGFLLSGQDKRRGGWSGCLNRSSVQRKDVKWNESFARKCSANYYFIQKERRFDKAATIIWNKIAPPRARNSHTEHQRRLAARTSEI